MDFVEGQDQLMLDGNLTFEQLTITAVDGNTAIFFGDQSLAVLEGVIPSLITVDDFIENMIS